jgi:hypothetical protein
MEVNRCRDAEEAGDYDATRTEDFGGEFKPDDAVKVAFGKWADWPGKVLKMTGPQRVKVLLSMFGKEHEKELDVGNSRPPDALCGGAKARTPQLVVARLRSGAMQRVAVPASARENPGRQRPSRAATAHPYGFYCRKFPEQPAADNISSAPRRIAPKSGERASLQDNTHR